jgi:hypothetical protein
MQTDRQTSTTPRPDRTPRLEWKSPEITRLDAGSAEGVVPGAAPPDFSQAPS